MSSGRGWYLNTDWLRSLLQNKKSANSLPPVDQANSHIPTAESTTYYSAAPSAPDNMSDVAPPPPTHAGRDLDPSDSVSNVGEQEQKPDTGKDGKDERTEAQKKADNELAERLSALIEDANSRVVPLTKMIRQHIDAMFARPDEERNEDELVKQVKPLLEQAEKILNETHGAIRGADPDKRLSNKATRHVRDHTASPQEQRLAEAIKVLVEEVGGTIEWAKNKLDAFPKAKKDLGPLLDALAAPLTQIVGGVGLLLAGVLNLVGNLLNGLGLGGLLKGIVTAMGLDKLYGSLGLGKLLSY